MRELRQLVFLVFILALLLVERRLGRLSFLSFATICVASTTLFVAREPSGVSAATNDALCVSLTRIISQNGWQKVRVVVVDVTKGLGWFVAQVAILEFPASQIFQSFFVVSTPVATFFTSITDPSNRQQFVFSCLHQWPIIFIFSFLWLVPPNPSSTFSSSPARTACSFRICCKSLIMAFFYVVRPCLMLEQGSAMVDDPRKTALTNINTYALRRYYSICLCLKSFSFS